MQRQLQNIGDLALDAPIRSAPEDIFDRRRGQASIFLESLQGAELLTQRALDVLFVKSFRSHVPRLMGESAFRDFVSLKRVSQR